MNLKKISILVITCLSVSFVLGQSYHDTVIAPAPPPPPPLQCPSMGCNLICHGNFENISPLYYNYFIAQRTTSHMVHKENSIDIYTVSPTLKVEDFQLSGSTMRSIPGGWRLALYPCAFTPANITAPEGNSFLGMTGYEIYSGSQRTYSEATYLKLRRPLVKDSVYKLMYWARRVTNDTSCVGTMNLEIRGSLMPPCHPDSFTPIYVNTPGGTSIPNCSYYYSQLIPSAPIGTTSWVEYTITFTATAPIAHLILTIPQSNKTDTKGAYAYFDDFRIFENKQIKLNYTTLSCGQSGHATLTASGGYSPYSFLWPDGTVAAQRYNLAAGKYPVTVTDAQGCEKVDTVKIDSSSYDFRLTAIVSNPRCKGSNDGSILVLPQGNTAPYTYAWTGGLPPVFYQYSLAPGTYKVIVRDKNNCQLTEEYKIIDTLQLLDIKTKTIVTPYICGGAKGSIRVRPQGGVKPYHVIWPDGRTDTARTDLLPGQYIVRVMDNNHCDKYDTFIVPKTGVYGNAKITLTPTYHCNLNAANIVSNVTVGVPPYTYLWSTGSTQSFTNNVSTVGNPKVYITYTEGTGCINKDSIQLKSYIDIGTGTIYPTAASARGVGKPFNPNNGVANREKFRVNGTFQVNSSIQFNYCDVIAKPGARIYVNASSLNMDSTTIRTCVDTMWQGIEVVQGVISLKRCTIEDALYAVEVKNINSNEQFDYNTFRNNYIGISYPPRANTSVQRFTYNTFTNNRFLCTTGRGSLKKWHSGMTFNPSSGNMQHGWYTSRAWAGMVICDFRHFFFSNNTFTNLMNGALFSNVSDPRSTKNVFTNMLYENQPIILNAYPNGIGLFVGNDKPEVNAWLVCEGRGKNNTQADFDNCRVGLTTVGNVTLYPMNETKMTNVFEGVNSISANASQIKNTNIQASHRGIYFL
ncbi:MAG: SprB repeat-containing protein, partial [Chitinophagales bacterium]